MNCKKWSGAVFAVICALMSAVVCSASATQVTLGQSTTGNVVITNTGPDNADISFSGDCGHGGANCLSGFGYLGATVGTYDMWITGGNPALESPTSGVYPVGMNNSTIDFSFVDGASLLDGDITLLSITDGTNTPRFIADLFITSSNIDGLATGTDAHLDFNIFLGNNPTIDQVYAGEAPSTQGPLSSGQIVPSTPEPSSFALFGTGMLGVAGVVRRKLKR